MEILDKLKKFMEKCDNQQFFDKFNSIYITSGRASVELKKMNTKLNSINKSLKRLKELKEKQMKELKFP